jgi:prepilin-type N-terminal cleavage/methylation domain-containing protein/prepilin-type processing-associated H-X9-DG protein
MRPKSRRGFTLVELLVVIAIIGILIGLALPVINAARAHARQMECSSNMRNVAMAVNMYEMTSRCYPGYNNVLIMNNGKPYSDPQTGRKRGVSWVIPLLAQLDQPVLQESWKTPAGSQSGLAASQHTEVKIVICPVDVPTIAGGTPLSYVANCGMKDVAASGGSSGAPRDWPENGVFFDHYTGDPRVGSGGAAAGQNAGGSNSGIPLVRMSSDYISRADGISSTMMISENVDAGNYTDYTEAKVGMVWDSSGTVDVSQNPPTIKPPDDTMRINVGTGDGDLQGGQVQTGQAADSGTSQSTTFARPSSFHSGGVNVAFCDARVKFVSDSIDYYVYCLMMSTNGKRVRQPGSSKVLPNFNRALNEAWLSP